MAGTGCDEQNSNWTQSIADAMETVNKYILQNFKPDTDSTKNPALDFTSHGFIVRRQFMDTYDNQESQLLWEEFINIKRSAIDNCASFIGREFEAEFGIEANHNGIFPDDWVKPGGFKDDDDYPVTTVGMQSLADVNLRRELKLTKVERENDLYSRKTNLINHAFTHKCSGYCAKFTSKRYKYDPTVYKDSDFDGKFLQKIDD